MLLRVQTEASADGYQGRVSRQKHQRPRGQVDCIVNGILPHDPWIGHGQYLASKHFSHNKLKTILYCVRGNNFLVTVVIAETFLL